MAEIITSADLPAKVRADVDADDLALMVAGANAKASRVAPCLASEDPTPTVDQLAEAKMILVGAVRRWTESGPGAVTQQTAGPFSQSIDTRQRTGYNLWPSEIKQLQELCSSGESTGDAYEVDTAPPGFGDGYWAQPNLWVPYL